MRYGGILIRVEWFKPLSTCGTGLIKQLGDHDELFEN